jgi:hypothetical protein
MLLRTLFTSSKKIPLFKIPGKANFGSKIIRSLPVKDLTLK